MQYLGVQATLTELRRKTGRVIGPVIHAGKSVEITNMGKVVASIQPRGRGMSGKEFAAWWAKRPRLGQELADEVAQNMRELRNASRGTAD